MSTLCRAQQHTHTTEQLLKQLTINKQYTTQAYNRAMKKINGMTTSVMSQLCYHRVNASLIRVTCV